MHVRFLLGGVICPGLRFAVRTVLLAAAALSLSLALAGQAHAVFGTVYSCTVHPTYKHPVTGAIEDSGGSSSVATGQAMVESCVSKSGMMEVTETGACYLTIRLSLIDLTSGHQFQVQEWGATGWSTPALGVTATGSDSSGTTNDVCIELPGQQGVVRISMYVDSMGRDVVFYAYADDLAEGVPSGFTPTIVTEASVAPVAASATGEVPASDGSAAPAGSAAAPAAAETAPAAAAPAAASETENSAQGADDLVGTVGASSARGLSLSTASEGAGVDAAMAEAVGAPGLPFAATAAFAAFAAGVGLMLVAAVIVYVFRRNWARWGGSDPDDYAREYRDA